jgi:large subunit ribosomal protein L9
MQIILLDKIASLGGLGEVVRVKDGYARNFLFPKGKARRATPAAIQAFEARRVELEKAAAEKLSAAQALACKLEDVTLLIRQKAGVDGKLFGSVTPLDIVHALAEHGVKIEKTQLRLPAGLLKVLGEHVVPLVLHTDVVVDVKLTIAAQTG